MAGSSDNEIGRGSHGTEKNPVCVSNSDIRIDPTSSDLRRRRESQTGPLQVKQGITRRLSWMMEPEEVKLKEARRLSEIRREREDREEDYRRREREDREEDYRRRESVDKQESGSRVQKTPKQETELRKRRPRGEDGEAATSRRRSRSPIGDRRYAEAERGLPPTQRRRVFYDEGPGDERHDGSRWRDRSSKRREGQGADRYYREEELGRTTDSLRSREKGYENESYQELSRRDQKGSRSWSPERKRREAGRSRGEEPPERVRSSQSPSDIAQKDGDAPRRRPRLISVSSGCTTSSYSECSCSECDERRQRLRHEERKRRRRRRREKEYRRRVEKRRRRAEPEPASKIKSTESSDDASGAEAGRTGAVSGRYGKYGVVSEADRFRLRPEFQAWLIEQKGIAYEELGGVDELKYFRDFMEDYNTATFPTKKYYNVADWESKRRHRGGQATRQAAEAGVGGAGMTIFDDEAIRRRELLEKREATREAELAKTYEQLKADTETRAAMKQQKSLRSDMDYLFKTGKHQEALAIQARLRPDDPNPAPPPPPRPDYSKGRKGKHSKR